MDLAEIERTIERMRQRSLEHLTKLKPYTREHWRKRGLECEDCTDFVESYMVEDEVWLAAHPSGHRGMLCLHCLEARLGRPIIASDFTNAMVNLPVLYGMAAALREQATHTE